MKWVLVALLWGVALLNYLDRQVIFSQFPLLEHDLHATPAQLGLVSTVFLWVYAALSPFAGYLADLWGRIRVILGSLLVWSAATWFTANVHSVSSLLWSRVWMGVSEAFYLPAALAAIADRHGPETRSLATGIHQSGLYAGAALGGVLGGWMGQVYGWRLTFVVLGIAGAAYFLISALALPRDPKRHAELKFGASLAGLLRTPGFLPLAAAFGAVSISNWLIYTWLPLFLYERLHMSLPQAGFYATVFIQVSSYVGMVAGGRTADHWSAKFPRARVACQMAGLAATAPLLVFLTFTTSRLVLASILILIGLCRPLFDINTMPVLRQIAPSEWCATGYGIFNLVGCFSGGVAALFAGYLKDRFGLAAAYQVAAIVLLAGAAALARIQAPQEQGTGVLSTAR
ncbi:MAG TPA: MFS transporter [Bryobacteraceae bacterium]|nr:MFS transporter [Bryobacteraceae bacterium]